MRHFLILLILLAAGLADVSTVHAQMLYRSEAFAVTDTSVVQGPFEAVAVTPRRLVSSYPRPVREIFFKFSLNGRDNERPPGEDHRIYLKPNHGRYVTPVYTFGVLDPPGMPEPEVLPAGGDDATVDVTFRLDLRHVLRSFEEQGVYDPPNGEPIARDDFEGVYVAGSEAPLHWDFDALPDTDRFRLRDPDGDGIYEVTLRFDNSFMRPLDEGGRAVWTQTADLSAFPQLTSPQRLVDALYRLSLEEMLQDVREDGAFMAGAKWTGVWTRDISYSILLALAFVDPDAARRSLMAKVADGHIIQDTGTGGSWPVSTDRMTWALAAWEVYTVTGDRAWLRTAYDLIRTSAEADLQTAFDEDSGLFYGESSFLDWREQTYPRWMDPKDIYRSQNLGTNAVHYQTYRILGWMADALGEPSARYRAVADAVRRGMNAHLWMSDRGYYGQYRYGRAYPALSPRAEALGESLALLFGVASPEQRRTVLAHVPLVPYGVPSIYPQIPGIPPYHNNGIWPFVVAYWTWAAAESGHAAAVEHGLAATYRAAALFLTNKENMVAETGHFEGTEINSDRQLWSVAGTLASVYRVLFGMRFEPDRLVFRPFVPEAYAGTRTLTRVPYRGATLTITVHGFGDAVDQATLDGTTLDTAAVPATLTGAHTLELTLNGRTAPGAIHLVPNRFSPATPALARTGSLLAWDAVEDAVAYEVFRNGDLTARTAAMRYSLPDTTRYAEYQVRALGPSGFASFLSAPVRILPEASVLVVPPPGPLADAHAGFTDGGYLRLTKTEHTSVAWSVDVPEGGVYGIDVRYANGSGPINTDNKAATRSLLVDGVRVGAVVMPQRGRDRWDDWGYSNLLRVPLTAGRHTLHLAFTPSDENMNGDVNAALVDHLRLIRLKETSPQDAAVD